MFDRADVPRHQYGNFVQKAVENAHAMKKALQDASWNTAALLAVHCAISSTDALTVHFLGKRSKSQRHQDAAALLKTIPLPSVEEKSRQLLSILELKNKVEYEEELIPEKKTRILVEQAERFYQWAKSQLPKQY